MNNIRPYYFNMIEEFCLILCQKQGWFSEKTIKDLTSEDKSEPHWVNNFQYALASYDFWKEEIES